MKKLQFPLIRQLHTLCQEAGFQPDSTWDCSLEFEVTSNETDLEFFEVVYITTIIESADGEDGVSFDECFFVRDITEGWHKPTRVAELHRFDLIPVDQRPKALMPA